MVTLLLGPFEVRDGSAPLRLGGRKPRALLARLALDANRTVPVERLIEDLWGEDVPGTAAKMVQIHVSQLRKVLPAGVLVTRPGGYALVADPEAIDLVRFERLRDAGRVALAGGDPRAAARLLGEALALWRGEALAEFTEPFAALEAARLAQLRLDCAEDRIDAELALGHHAAVTAELEALVAREPLRERPRAQLMLALYRGGRHADALATLQDLRRTLDEELGLVPSAALGELERRILHHDPSLSAPDLVPAAPRSAAAHPPEPEAEHPPVAPTSRIATTPARRRVTAVALSFVEDAVDAAADPEDLHELSKLVRRRTADVVERLGGCLAPAAGDRIIAGFGLAVAREDDVRRAVRAALELRDAIPDATAGSAFGAVTVHVAVDTGMAIVTGDERAEGLGCGVAVAATRLLAQAPAGAVVLSPAAARLVRDTMVLRPARGGAMEVRGEAAPDAARASRSPFVGRAAELALMAERHRRAAAGRGQAVLLVGEPGIGKSRLVDELLARVAGEDAERAATTFRCSPDHTQSPLYPVAARLREDPERWRAAARACGLPPVEAALLETQLAPASAALAEPPVEVSPEEQHRRLLGAVTDVLLDAGDATPPVLVVEDLHWADPTTLELLERLVRELATEPILVLVTLRPERVPAWASASYATVVTLDHLGASELEALVGGILNVATPPDGLVSTIEERSDGVPLFAEELLLALRDAGTLRRTDAGWELADLRGGPAVPDTLHDLLLARLDRLGTARIVAEVGAVLGRRFDRELLQEVAELDERALDEGLARLVDAELLHVRGRGASARYFFKHALIRDAAYASLVRSARRSLHARVARMLEERRPDSVAAAPEVLARHLDAAGDHVAAASSWLRAGALALRAPAYVEAMAHYEAGLRTLQALPGEAPQTLELDLQLGLGSARMAALGYAAEATQAAYARAEHLSDELEDSARLAPALYGLAVYACARGDGRRSHELALRLRRVAEAAGDTDTALEADVLLAIFSCLLGEFEDGFAAVDRALAVWDPERHRCHMFSFGQEPGVAVYTARVFLLAWTGRIDEARRVGADGLRVARGIGHPLSLAYLLAGVGIAELVAGEPERVARAGSELRELTIEHDLSMWRVWADVLCAWARAREGDLDGGLAAARAALEARADIGFLSLQPYFLAMVAEVALDAGRLDVAESLLAEARPLTASSGERIAEPDVERVTGRLAAARGDHALAERAFARALERARVIGMPSGALHAARELAELRAAAGCVPEARSLVAAVLDELPDQQATAEVAAARALLDRLASGAHGAVTAAA
jgi:DNA-binding SARP family transcriptional activator/tetratricopeptide (TPR) repeat protein